MQRTLKRSDCFFRKCNRLSCAFFWIPDFLLFWGTWQYLKFRCNLENVIYIQAKRRCFGYHTMVGVNINTKQDFFQISRLMGNKEKRLINSFSLCPYVNVYPYRLNCLVEFKIEIESRLHCVDIYINDCRKTKSLQYCKKAQVSFFL